MTRPLGLLWLLFLWWTLAAPACAGPVSALAPPEGALGLELAWLQESGPRLTFHQAATALNAGRFSPGRAPALNFGIGARPAWLHLAVHNPTATALPRRLSLETPWLDRVELYVLRGGRLVASQVAGDHLPHSRWTPPGRYFLFDHDFAPGTSDVFLRVATPDPMVLPLHLATPEAARARENRQTLSYGLVYGFLLALMAYNALLFVSLKSTRYLLYSVYLAAFISMNLAYTGHGFAAFWPEALFWQAWSNPTLMVLYGVCGLLFAIRFLDLGILFPRARRGVLTLCASAVLLLAVFAFNDLRAEGLWVAFNFAFLFSLLMPALGILTVRTGHVPARYFLLASLAAMTGALLTTLSVWGFIPYNEWTFRAVEVGMLLDATLLAMALGHQFHVARTQKIRAEQLARMDPLTGLNNRRAFFDTASPLWSSALRHGHPTVVMLLDIDWFKRVNDTLGHAHGDAVLQATAHALAQSIRHGDVAARWGGEEFIVFLPETTLEAARVLAERLRLAIAAQAIPHASGATRVTASFGIAERNTAQTKLDELIAEADACLYRSKQQGRNRVTSTAGLGILLPAR